MWKSGTCHVLMARVAYVARPAATSRYGDAFAAKKSTLTTLNQISGSAMADKPAFERVKQSQPHPLMSHVKLGGATTRLSTRSGEMSMRMIVQRWERSPETSVNILLFAGSRMSVF